MPARRAARSGRPTSRNPSDAELRTSHLVRQRPRRRHRVLWLIVIVATSVRLAIALQVSGTPLASLDAWAQSDMHFYAGWARTIASGDLLSRHAAVPMHVWHRQVASQHLEAHPDAAAPGDADPRTDGAGDPHARLWSQWMRSPAFYQDPLYPYLVAGTFRLAGGRTAAVLAWQALLGVLTTVIIWRLSQRFFGDEVALVAAGLAVLCAPLVYYESILLRDSPIVFVTLLSIWLMTQALDRPAWWRFAALGGALGAGVLLKSSLALVAAGALAGVATIYHGRWRELAAACSATLAGLALALAPLALRNSALGLPPFTMATSGPLTFVAANVAGYQPGDGFSVDVPVMAGFLGGTDGGWRSAVRTAFAGHGVGSYAALLWGKWDRAWHWREIPNNENFYYATSEVAALRWLPVTAFVLSPLALVGLALAAPGFRRIWPLYLLVAAALAPLLAFYVLGRFRVLLIAAIVPFAALTVTEIVRAARRARIGRALVLGAATVAIASWTGRGLPPGEPLIRASDRLLPYSVGYEARILEALDRQDWLAAARACGEYLDEKAPDAAVAAVDADLARTLAGMHRQCAGLWHRAGAVARVPRLLERADRLAALAGR